MSMASMQVYRAQAHGSPQGVREGKAEAPQAQGQLQGSRFQVESS